MSRAVELDFEKLPLHQPRTFVPENIDLTQVKNVKSLYQQLLDRKIPSQEVFEQWILDRSELDSALGQSGDILYIRMTCQTDDKSRAGAYENFIKEISPVVQPIEDQMNKKFLEALQEFALDEERFGMHIRETKADIELFRKKNVPLNTEVSLLSQEYQTICGAMSVEFEGEERTMPQMGKYLLQTDRSVREAAWKAVSQRRLKDQQKLDDLFDKMLKIRHQIALNADCQNFCEYKFRSLHRFDYTSDDCKLYHDTIEKVVVPICQKISERRRKQMQLDDLRPWDTAVDPLGRDPLKPFEDVDKLIQGCDAMFHQVDPELGAQFSDMAKNGLLDLASRKGKAPGGYQNTLDESRKPFIFMNAVGLDNDIRTLLHEGGHAFHALACAHHDLVDYRHGPMEFNEVASMAMELLAGEYLSVFYNKDDETRSKLDHLEDVLFTLVWVATIDCFQHWIYENPTHTANERRKAWLKIHQRFSTNVVNWEGFEEEHAYLWHRQLHIFEVPFYYIEYGIAQLGALQVWCHSKKDKANALRQYREGLSLGGSQPLPKIYQTAGIQFNFSKDIIVPLMEEVTQELQF